MNTPIATSASPSTSRPRWSRTGRRGRTRASESLRSESPRARLRRRGCGRVRGLPLAAGARAFARFRVAAIQRNFDVEPP